jgi:hypothetical protein
VELGLLDGVNVSYEREETDRGCQALEALEIEFRIRGAQYVHPWADGPNRL